jgi:hypothetical protein
VTLAIEADPLPTVETLRAAAVVQFVAEAPGFLASLLVVPGFTPVARLAHALAGHPEEGRVLRECMLATTGSLGSDLFLWTHDSLLCLTP